MTKKTIEEIKEKKFYDLLIKANEILEKGIEILLPSLEVVIYKKNDDLHEILYLLDKNYIDSITMNFILNDEIVRRNVDKELAEIILVRHIANKQRIESILMDYLKPLVDKCETEKEILAIEWHEPEYDEKAVSEEESKEPVNEEEQKHDIMEKNEPEEEEKLFARFFPWLR